MVVLTSNLEQCCRDHRPNLVNRFTSRIEKLFARHIGPMARVLVRREARSADSPESLCRALAGHIDKPAERLRFLNDAGY